MLTKLSLLIQISYLIINQNLQIIAISGSLEKYIIKGNANNTKSIKNDLIALELDHFFSNDSVKRISAFLKTIETESLEKAVDMKYLGVNKNKNLVFSASISIIRYGKSENFFMSLFDETQSSVQKNYLNELLSKDYLQGPILGDIYLTLILILCARINIFFF